MKRQRNHADGPDCGASDTVHQVGEQKLAGGYIGCKVSEFRLWIRLVGQGAQNQHGSPDRQGPDGSLHK